jgi:hypothetical protein
MTNTIPLYTHSGDLRCEYGIRRALWRANLELAERTIRPLFIDLVDVAVQTYRANGEWRIAF